MTKIRSDAEQRGRYRYVRSYSVLNLDQTQENTLFYQAVVAYRQAERAFYALRRARKMLEQKTRITPEFLDATLAYRDAVNRPGAKEIPVVTVDSEEALQKRVKDREGTFFDAILGADIAFDTYLNAVKQGKVQEQELPLNAHLAHGLVIMCTETNLLVSYDTTPNLLQFIERHTIKKGAARILKDHSTEHRFEYR